MRSCETFKAPLPIVPMSSRKYRNRPSCYRAKGALWNRSKHRLLPLALLAFFLQASLPFFITNCPLAMAGQSVTGSVHTPTHSTASDCPMLAGHHAGFAQDGSHKDPQSKHSVSFCPLCNVLSPFSGYVEAGLISLPPPLAISKPSFIATNFVEAAPYASASFSARAPPITV